MDAAATKLRTFIAIDLPAAARQALRERQAQVQCALADTGVPSIFRWSAVDNIHLTLRFLGDTTPAQCTAVADAVAVHLSRYVANEFPFTFTLQIGELGGFPTLRRPRVVWLGVGGDVEALAGVQAAVESAVVEAGFAPEPKPFRAHLTLARVRRNAASRAVQAAGATLVDLAAQSSEGSSDLSSSESGALTFPVTEVIHYRSELRRDGSVYTPLAAIPLA